MIPTPGQRAGRASPAAHDGQPATTEEARSRRPVAETTKRIGGVVVPVGRTDTTNLGRNAEENVQTAPDRDVTAWSTVVIALNPTDTALAEAGH